MFYGITENQLFHKMSHMISYSLKAKREPLKEEGVERGPVNTLFFSCFRMNTRRITRCYAM